MRAPIDVHFSWKREIGGSDEGSENHGESVSVDIDNVFRWICGFSALFWREWS